MEMLNAIRKMCGYQFPRMGRATSIFFKCAPGTVNCELFPGIVIKNMNMNDLTQRSTFWQGARFEYPTLPLLRSWGGTRFFDIGANYGFFSYYMYSECPNLNIHSFEPNPKTFAVMERIRNENNLQRLQTNQIGLGSKSGMFDLHPGKSDSGHSTFLQHPEFVDETISQVRVETFDSWRKTMGLELPRAPEWVAKIDTEGFDLDVLQGMAESLRAKAFRGLVVEVLEHTLALAGHSIFELKEFMKANGYVALDKSFLIKRYGSADVQNAFFIPEQ